MRKLDLPGEITFIPLNRIQPPPQPQIQSVEKIKSELSELKEQLNTAIPTSAYLNTSVAHLKMDDYSKKIAEKKKLVDGLTTEFGLQILHEPNWVSSLTLGQSFSSPLFDKLLQVISQFSRHQFFISSHRIQTTSQGDSHLLVHFKTITFYHDFRNGHGNAHEPLKNHFNFEGFKPKSTKCPIYFYPPTGLVRHGKKECKKYPHILQGETKILRPRTLKSVHFCGRKKIK
ncbi:unnamed protein product [Nesidiocoris tenuis]|uniref:Uncharacterized protein n=1 Tax=Nesidiocoris tenuis TaxID=355587 RepID=A0A6H5H745_9HEMI|nr:unnamed protein product [Nesidiocoris tenuis]